MFQIVLHDEYPKYICPICFSILKISLKFIYQFQESENTLKTKLGESNVLSPQEDNEKIKSKYSPEYQIEAPVEVIYGENKFNLSDLLVVETAEEENCNFKGFLDNLGTEVSATFVEKSDKCSLENIKEGQVSISLVANDKILPVKELQLEEETNTIKCLVVENYLSEEEILKLEIVKDEDDDNNDDDEDEDDIDESDSTEHIQLDAQDVDVESLIIENGLKKMDRKSINYRKKVKHKERKLLEESDDIFEKEMRYPCDICGKIFEYPDRLKAHKRRIHVRDEKVYYCDICGYKNNTLSGKTILNNFHKLNNHIINILN